MIEDASRPPFGEVLRRYRQAAGLSQEELGLKSDLSTRAISDLERGVNQRPRKATLALLADGLGLSAEERHTLEEAAQRSLPLSPLPIWALRATIPDGDIANPYKGLRAFREEDAPDFFGREALTYRLLTRLAETGPLTRFLVVVGPSGSGKSSVVRAGLIPSLHRDGLPALSGLPDTLRGAAEWPVVHMVPGPHPLEELEAALLRVAVNPPPSLMEQLQSDERGLVRAVKRVLPEREEIELVLVIDQFEEVFTLVEDEGARVHFLDSICAAAADPRSRVRIIATLRADFYDRPLLYPDPGELVRQRTEVVLPLTSDELYQAITAPAERVGVECEAELVAAIIHDVGEQPGTLPLLQYALTELFERRVGLAGQTGPTMTMAAYRETGGVLGALERRSEETYAGLSSAEQALARQVFLRLVTLGEGVEDTRRRAHLSELSSLASEGTTNGSTDQANDQSTLEGVLTAFGRYRLLTFDWDERTGEATVEVAHEAMLRSWPRLGEWLEESREDLRVQRRLMQEASDWAQAGRDSGLLSTGTRLAQFEGLAAAGEVALTSEEREYLATSVEERDRQMAAEQTRQAHELQLAQEAAEAAKRTAAAQRSAASRLRVLVAAMALFLAVAVALSVFAVNRSQAADDNAQRAQLAAATAVANQNEAETQRGLAVKSEATVAANLTRSEAQRLAAQASTLIEAGQFPETAALLSLRSMNTLYTPEGDAALLQATTLQFPVRQFEQPQNDGALRAAFSPDGRFLFTAGNGTPSSSAVFAAYLWDVQSGEKIGQFVGHRSQINYVAFSPDGKQVLTAGSIRDNTARLWDVETGNEVRQFPHPDGVIRVGFSPDGKYILTGSRDKIVRLWDRQTGEELRQFTGHTDAIRGTAFSPDGKWIVTGGDDKTARLWDATTGELLRTFTGHTGSVRDVAFSPDGIEVLTSSQDKTARLWDATTGESLRTFTGHTQSVQGVAFSPDGKWIATGSDDNTARLWDPTTGVELNRFIGHNGIVDAVFSPDGEYLLTGNRDSIAHLWAVRSQAITLLLPHDDAVTEVKFSSDGKLVLTSASTNDAMAHLWDARSGVELLKFEGHTAAINSVAFSPDGKLVATSANNSATNDRTLRLWDAQTGQLLRRFDLKFGISTTGHAITFSPDGKWVLIGGTDDIAHLLDVETGQEVRALTAHSEDVRGVAFSPSDGKRVVTGSGDKLAKIWATETATEVLTLTGHTAGLYSAVFSPDGKMVLTASEDGTARLWDAQTGQEIRLFTGHAGQVRQAVFSSDGKWIATAGDDITARLWDIQTGHELRRFVGHKAQLQAVAISPDGKYVATGSDDFTVRVWQTDYHEAVRYLCARLSRDFTDQERAQYGIQDKEPTCPKP